MVKVAGEEPRDSMIERGPFKWVRVSTELLAELGKWCGPVEVMIVEDKNNVLELVFRRTHT